MTLFLTRSEIFSAAWRRLRSVHGAKATPRQHPAFWKACLCLSWQAAKGDAFLLTALRDDAREAARRTAPKTQISRPARSYSSRVAGSGVRWA
jgi:ABC-type ATPase with predicted acetyltransferase domain